MLENKMLRLPTLFYAKGHLGSASNECECFCPKRKISVISSSYQTTKKNKKLQSIKKEKS